MPGFLHLAFGLLLRGICFIRTQTEISQRATKTVAISQTGENVSSRHVWKSRVEILFESSSRNVLAKFKIWVNCQRCLVSTSQIVRVHVKRICNAWMFAEFFIRLMPIIGGQPRPIQTCIGVSIG